MKPYLAHQAAVFTVAAVSILLLTSGCGIPGLREVDDIPVTTSFRNAQVEDRDLLSEGYLPPERVKFLYPSQVLEDTTRLATWVRAKSTADGLFVFHNYSGDPVPVTIEVFRRGTRSTEEENGFVRLFRRIFPERGFERIARRDNVRQIFTEIVLDDVENNENILVRVSAPRQTSRPRQTTDEEARLNVGVAGFNPRREEMGPSPLVQGDTIRQIAVLSRIQNPETDPQTIQSLYNDSLGLGFVTSCPCGGDSLNIMLTSVPDHAVLEIVKEKAEEQVPDVDTLDINRLLTPPASSSSEDSRLVDYEAAGSYVDFVNNPVGSSNNPPVVVAIIDSGADTDNATLQPFLWSGSPAIRQPCVQLGRHGFDFLNFQGDVTDTLGHGTSVAGVLISDWPSDLPLRIMPLKFTNGEGSLFNAVCAMYFAAGSGIVDIMNLSWGVRGNTISPLLAAALRAAQREDVIIVTSAGNDAVDIDSDKKWPASAALPNMVVVAAYEPGQPADSTDLPFARFSNFGATAVNMMSPPSYQTLQPNSSTLVVRVGTSLSAPYIIRLIARELLENPLQPAPITIDSVRADLPVSTPAGENIVL